MDLTPEQRQKIYEEEKAKTANTQTSKKKNKLLIGCLGCSGLVAVLFLSLILIGLLAPKQDSDSSSSYLSEETKKILDEPTPYKIGDWIDIGYTSYVVEGIQWRKRIGDSYLGADANARFLLVTVSVRNNDKESRMIPPFHLVDEDGNRYDSDEGSAMYLGDKGFLLKSLNPAVSKTGVVLFDVPPDHKYKLLISGGYWSSEETTVILN